MCDCSKYGHLSLEVSSIEKRAEKYSEMREVLKQLTQKVIERGFEHYRLYKCTECGQLWQSSLTPGWGDTFYLFKIPSISQAEWRKEPFVAPDMIVAYIKEQNDFMDKEFDLKEDKCSREGCEKLAIIGSMLCQYHQFLKLGEIGSLRAKPTGRWFGPYTQSLLAPNQQRNADSGADAPPPVR
jgi:hypothetical protein